MGKYPVTQAQYEAVMGNNPSYFQNAEKAPLSQSWGNHPVECVSWNDAQEFCRKLSQLTGKTYKLPSESQWEYACRSEKLEVGSQKEGKGKKWCYGDDESKLGEYAWYRANSNSQTHPVGEKKPNKWGLYDMHGNVWEWCEDDWVDNYRNTPRDGTEHRNKPMKYIVLCSGSWLDNPRYCRSAFRSYNTRVFHDYDIGFRVVCVVGKTS